MSAKQNHIAADIIIVVLIMLVVGFLLGPTLGANVTSRPAAGSSSERLGQIHRGLADYAAKTPSGSAPGVNEGLWKALAPYLGESGSRGPGAIWRADVPGSEGLVCGFAVNASLEEPNELIGAFSLNSKLANTLSALSPNTIEMVEMCATPGSSEAMQMAAIRSYRTPRPVVFDSQGRLTDPGNYLFLAAYVGKRLDQMYHDGFIEVLYADGHVASVNLKDLIQTAKPIDNPAWTRQG